MSRRPPTSTLFPYPTLFRSEAGTAAATFLAALAAAGGSIHATPIHSLAALNRTTSGQNGQGMAPITGNPPSRSPSSLVLIVLRSDRKAYPPPRSIHLPR